MKPHIREPDLIELLRKSEETGNYYYKQEDIARDMGIAQSTVSKIIDKAEMRGIIEHINHQYRLADITRKSKTIEQLYTLFKEYPCRYTLISSTSFALDFNSFKHKILVDLLQQFFGDLYFSSFSADKLLIVLLQSGHKTEVKELRSELKKIIKETKENNSNEP